MFEKMRPEVAIVNVVATSTIGDNIDLGKIAREVKNTHYNTSIFPGSALSVDGPKADFHF